MMLNKLDAVASNFSALPSSKSTSLDQRLRDVVGAGTGGEERRPDFSDLVPEIQPIQEKPGTKPMPVSPKEMVDMMCRKWFEGEFLQAMMLGDPDEKLGVKPEPYAD
ncbi:hypothetical protein [Stenotrophomonas sp. 278]|uniref:hypothetical protein n=1 Tax=Stenotrophomonas sp. 278 TaxID=2479851 RepID=UPI000F691D0C|nr:hypothetical protein [Stenotrophomonas sp. 278]RRU21161.1 hypothetical protein EGJ34_04425 [Stenotrophomonas sp. 278]